jgi:hypothetical protein
MKRRVLLTVALLVLPLSLAAEPYAPWAPGLRATEEANSEAADRLPQVPERSAIDLPRFSGSSVVSVSPGDADGWPRLTLITDAPLPEVRRFYLDQANKLPDWHFDGRYDLLYEGASWVMSMTQQAPTLRLEALGPDDREELTERGVASSVARSARTLIRVVYREPQQAAAAP